MTATHIDPVVVVAGLRTPFLRSGTGFSSLSARDLGAMAVRELVARMPPGLLPERVVFGQVLPSLAAPNVARELVLDIGLPPSVDAYSVSRACATGYQAVADAAWAIAAGDIDIAIAGGTDSASDVPVTLSTGLSRALVAASRAKSVAAKAKSFAELRPHDLRPQPPSIAERASGLTMGQHAEIMAKDFEISRQAQDDLAHRSHTRAAAAWNRGDFSEDVMTVTLADGLTLDGDNTVRFDSQREAYTALRPAFDRRYGTITAGNSTGLTDGASAVLLMKASTAKAAGLRPLASLRSVAFSAVDLRPHMLIGPALAIPKAMARANIGWRDITRLDLHEAFAAQVLAVQAALGSAAWSKQHRGVDQAVGDVDWDKTNVDGGSLALGHPFAATGARQLLQTARAVARAGGGIGVLSACAAGGLAAAMVIEVMP